MSVVALACGNQPPDSLTQSSRLRFHQLPNRPGKADVDELLPPNGRLIVYGRDSDLAAVVLRLLRREALHLEIGYLPAERDSAIAKLHGASTVDGEARPVPLARDDVGGVLVGQGVIEPVTGSAYCDSEHVLHGPAKRIVVSPHAESGLEVTVVRGALRRKTHHSRAFQLACEETQVSLDGVRHPRPMTGWTWYRHTTDLLLVR
ncbi:hypothetical protein D5S17_17975 [Pseudonocardiaceae bacterium YIM PH 21723]|nr:hypothetical protein D5S17_17975 [Pseudonocardiaceae bacterium YIM PH 21723]